MLSTDTAMSLDDILRFLVLQTILGIPIWIVILLVAIWYYLWRSRKRLRF